MSEECRAVPRGTQWVSVREGSEGLGRVNSHHICTSSTTEAQGDNCEGRINKLPSINNGNCLFVGKNRRENLCWHICRPFLFSFLARLSAQHNYCRIFLCGRFVTRRSGSFFIRASVTSGDLLASPWFHCIFVQNVYLR